MIKVLEFIFISMRYHKLILNQGGDKRYSYNNIEMIEHSPFWLPAFLQLGKKKAREIDRKVIRYVSVL